MTETELKNEARNVRMAAMIERAMADPELREDPKILRLGRKLGVQEAVSALDRIDAAKNAKIEARAIARQARQARLDAPKVAVIRQIRQIGKVFKNYEAWRIDNLAKV